MFQPPETDAVSKPYAAVTRALRGSRPSRGSAIWPISLRGAEGGRTTTLTRPASHTSHHTGYPNPKMMRMPHCLAPPRQSERRKAQKRAYNLHPPPNTSDATIRTLLTAAAARHAGGREAYRRGQVAGTRLEHERRARCQVVAKWCGHVSHDEGGCFAITGVRLPCCQCKKGEPEDELEGTSAKVAQRCQTASSKDRGALSSPPAPFPQSPASFPGRSVRGLPERRACGRGSEGRAAHHCAPLL